MELAIIDNLENSAAILQEMVYDFYHLPAYVKLMAEYEGGQGVAYIYQTDNICFYLPLIVKPVPASYCSDNDIYYDAASPYGWSGIIVKGEPSGEIFSRALAAFVDLCQQNKIIAAFVRMHPFLSPISDEFNRYGRIVQNGSTVAMDLNLPNAEICQQIRRCHQRGIKKWNNITYRVRVDEWQFYDQFIELYTETMQRVEAASYYYFPRGHFLALREALGQRIHLCTVEIADDVVCGGLFSEINGIVQYHLAGTKSEYLQQNPTKIMLNYMWQWAKQRGNQYFHLGSGVGGSDDPLFHFKAGFSKVRYPFYTWRSITDHDAYHTVIAKWEQLTGYNNASGDDFFPVYRRK